VGGTSKALKAGPLAGVRIVELAGAGPGPMCAMLLADLGATVLRIDRKTATDLGIRRPLKYDLLLRNRKSIALDLKQPVAVEVALQLIARADALIEGFRPGVMERLGLGPETCLQRNPQLVYGRMTGWGQTGPLAQTAGHDIGYIAVTGVLNAIGRRDAPPTIPLNLVGDYAGGSLYLAMGILAALHEAQRSGSGQVIDAAVVDGTASLATTFFGMHAAGMLNPGRGTNVADSGSHYYEVYQCADGKWISVGPLEARFYSQLLSRLGLDPATLGPQADPRVWQTAKAVLAERFRARSREEWLDVFADCDACIAPVLDWGEAPGHPHLVARNTFVEVDGIVQPSPAPRFSRTPSGSPTPPAPITPANTDAALGLWASREQITGWRAAGILD
jgi:crotonobetainyl-CoA:carnitine CoA-transferase CaiB-like acyl-CoA transferase